MSEISERIISIYNQLKDNESQQIDEHVVDDAVSAMNSIPITDTYSLFYVLAALNLLNAAIKNARHKSQLFYGFIKTKVSKIAEQCLKNQNVFNNISIYYDAHHKCIYFDVFELIFSFHQIL